MLLGDDAETLVCIAAATSCNVHVALQVEEDSTKDTEDEWLRQSPVAIEWDIQVDALIVDDEDTYHRTGAKALDQLEVGRSYLLRFSQTAGAPGEKNRDAVVNVMQLTGHAILNDLNITSQVGEVVTAVAQFGGVGELTPYNP